MICPEKIFWGEKYEDLNSTASLILNFSAYIAFVVAKKCKESQIEQQDEKKHKFNLKRVLIICRNCTQIKFEKLISQVLHSSIINLKVKNYFI